MILSENWKQSLAKMINRSEAKIEKFFQKHKPTFAQTLALGQAVENKDLVTVQSIMKSVSAVTEADNPFTAARTPTTAAQPVQPTRPASNQVSVRREPQNLQPGDRVKIDDLGGSQVEVEIQGTSGNILDVKTADGRVSQVAINDVVRETTAAGAIASSAVYTGPIIKRRPTRKIPNESSQPRSKKS